MMGITGYNWDYSFYKLGFVSSYNWYNSGHICVDFAKLVISRLSAEVFRTGFPLRQFSLVFSRLEKPSHADPRPVGMPQEP